MFKRRITRLQEQLQALTDQNHVLVNENKSLRNQRDALVNENKELRQQIKDQRDEYNLTSSAKPKHQQA